MTIRIYTHIAVNPTEQFGVGKRFDLQPLTDETNAWTDGGFDDYVLPNGFRAIANYGGEHNLFVDDNGKDFETFSIVNRHGVPALQSEHRTITLAR